MVLTDNPPELTTTPKDGCSSGCTGEPENSVSPALDDGLQALILRLANVSPEQRAAVLAMIQAAT